MYDFKVRPDGGEEFEVKATTRDVLRWEKGGKPNSRSMTLMQEEQRLGDLYEIAFYAAKREGLFDGKLSDFETTCDLDLKGVTDGSEPDDEVDPTQSEASTSESST